MRSGSSIEIVVVQAEPVGLIIHCSGDHVVVIF